MSVLILMIPVSLFLSLGFLGVFFWAVRTRQFERLDTVPYQVLDRDDNKECDSGT